jgi:hypothetical protein
MGRLTIGKDMSTKNNMVGGVPEGLWVACDKKVKIAVKEEMKYGDVVGMIDCPCCGSVCRLWWSSAEVNRVYACCTVPDEECGFATSWDKR